MEGERERVRERERESEVMGEGTIFQAIYCNHHSLINQTFHHKSSTCVYVHAIVYIIAREPLCLITDAVHPM